MLADFAVLSEMLADVAKWKFLSDNPSRKRTPRGFIDGVTLTLTGVQTGSAIPIIRLVVPAVASLFPPTVLDYYELARTAIVGAVRAAEQGRPATDHLPAELLGYFDRFGRSLEDDEAIEAD